ncbi:alpha/beta hydrolase [Flammeovirga sp. MY04]|uniref:alpha/beta hydrolase n=1 Tax=Flammeovirga sp. MY04 TaxID=1191459 RepID=UPI0008060E35|nr:alpha/beta hydrolase [Flammeovirga sp. MY04]ANQ49337.1 alpha/beta hydrolase [Flammeovirga sp. MY04]
MEYQEEWVKLQVEAPFVFNREATKETEHVWFLFHGYGQLAEHFIRRFDILEEHHHVVALQGLSRFYLDDKYEKIGASWMTRMHREKDIIHQKKYIEEVVQNRLLSIPSFDVKRNFFAFSQGGATLLRWLVDAQPEVNALILWAADIPKEFTVEDFDFLSPDSKVIYVIGDNDPFRSFIEIEKLKDFIKQLKCETDIVTFRGGHSVNRPTLKTVLKNHQLF